MSVYPACVSTSVDNSGLTKQEGTKIITKIKKTPIPRYKNNSHKSIISFIMSSKKREKTGLEPVWQHSTKLLDTRASRSSYLP